MQLDEREIVQRRLWAAFQVRKERRGKDRGSDRWLHPHTGRSTSHLLRFCYLSPPKRAAYDTHSLLWLSFSRGSFCGWVQAVVAVPSSKSMMRWKQEKKMMGGPWLGGIEN